MTCMGVEGEGEELGRVGRGKLVKREGTGEWLDKGEMVLPGAFSHAA